MLSLTRQLPPVEKQLPRLSLARTYFTRRLYRERERERERDTVDTTAHKHDTHHIPVKKPAFWHRFSCRYQLHLSLIIHITNPRKRRATVSIFSQNKTLDKPQKNDTWKRRL